MTKGQEGDNAGRLQLIVFGSIPTLRVDQVGAGCRID
jgi:hypothetical protein